MPATPMHEATPPMPFVSVYFAYFAVVKSPPFSASKSTRSPVWR